MTDANSQTRPDDHTKKLKKYSVIEGANETDLNSAFGKKYISLAFASESMGSPASIFGHIFFVFHNSQIPEPDAQAISFYARTSKDHGLLSYLVNGMTGKYYGRFISEKFFRKTYENSDQEQRFISLYQLKLNLEERKRLKKYFKLNWDKEFKYYFFTDNCASFAIDAVNFAKSINQKTTALLPESMIKNIQDELGDVTLIEPSRYTAIRIFKKLPTKKRQSAISKLKKNLDTNSLTDPEQELINNLHNWAFHYKKIKTYNFKKQYRPTGFKLDPAYIDRFDPLRRTPSSFASGGISNQGFIARFRYLKNDYTSYSSSIDYSEFQAFDTSVAISSEEKITLREFSLIKASSISTSIGFEDSPSWFFTSGFNRFFKSNDLYYENRLKMGYAVGLRDLFVPYASISHLTNLKRDIATWGFGSTLLSIENKYFKTSFDLGIDFFKSSEFTAYNIQSSYKFSENILLALAFRRVFDSELNSIEFRMGF